MMSKSSRTATSEADVISLLRLPLGTGVKDCKHDVGLAVIGGSKLPRGEAISLGAGSRGWKEEESHSRGEAGVCLQLHQSFREISIQA